MKTNYEINNADVKELHCYENRLATDKVSKKIKIYDLIKNKTE